MDTDDRGDNRRILLGLASLVLLSAITFATVRLLSGTWPSVTSSIGMALLTYLWACAFWLPANRANADDVGSWPYVVAVVPLDLLLFNIEWLKTMDSPYMPYVLILSLCLPHGLAMYQIDRTVRKYLRQSR